MGNGQWQWAQSQSSNAPIQTRPPPPSPPRQNPHSRPALCALDFAELTAVPARCAWLSAAPVTCVGRRTPCPMIVGLSSSYCVSVTLSPTHHSEKQCDVEHERQ